ncbi:putative glucokinase regulator family protein [Coniochaeta ligniaria NRRL 30616]|uniref:N-acetyl-D-glucosamine kinase n=1 Tax=Coniochaeta ligniaria NRRL 30616 TaxID=1408157 RepID=A0A1J7IIE4_9PEZI|nr:putative glucokinase regulator family protein [Coniochaeta ligniaria NRRL 30616]
MSTPVVQLAGLQTEDRNPRTTCIDRVPTLELCRILNQEDSTVPSAVEPCIPVIAEVIDVLSERVRKGGRVFYIGAGTSGRLGVLDASEIPPTYSAPAGQFIALMAGGDYALRHAKEGAEDDRDAAKVDLQPFNIDPAVDSLIGIASSGRTPYVLGGLSYMKSLGATTVAVVCVSPSAAGVEGNADYLISAVTGPEAVTGSTRMKAGTATKLVLNMISSGVMIKLGKTYGNLMIDVKATNIKLKQRARNILRFVGGDACTQTDEQLDQILQDCRGSAKLAAVTIVLKVSVIEAEERLQRNSGVLARVFEEAREEEAQREDRDEGLVLCVDAGGTSCKAVILSKDGEMGTGIAGPCNATNVGIDAAICTISNAIQDAVDNCKITKGRRLKAFKLSAAWVGMAGYDRPSLSSAIYSALSELLRLPLGAKLKVTTDIDLLPTCVSSGNELDHIVVVVAGTGSIAMSYAKVEGQFQRTERIGGWGSLLGDDGSGFGIGREALRTALSSSDLYRIQAGNNVAATRRTLPPLSQAIVQHFKDLYPESKPEDLLSTILVPDPAQHQAKDAALATTKRIASVARIVLSMASSDDEARRIVDAGVASLVNLVTLLVHAQGIDPARSALVLAGGMMQDEGYRGTLAEALEAKCGKFKQTERVTQPAVAGARYLQRQERETSGTM